MKKWWAIAGLGVLLLIGLSIYSFGTISVNNVAAFSKMLMNQAITVSFSNPIKQSSMTEESIIVKDQEGNVIPVTYTIGEDVRTIVMKPKEEGYFLQEGNYLLELSDQITSRFGFPLSGEREFEFKVYATLPNIASEDELRAILLADLEEESKFSIMNESTDEESTADKSNGSDFSETNVQVEGIDEGDIVKTDGEYIYSANHEAIFITDAAQMKVVSTITFEKESYPQEFFLQDDKLVAISQKYGYSGLTDDKNMLTNGFMTINIYDVSNKEKPELLKEIGVEGDYRTSRLHNSHMYVIASQYPDVWILRESEDTEIVPRYFDSENGIRKQELDKIQYVPQSQDKNYMHLLAVDLNSEPFEYNIETILGSGENVYMSYANLYLAANHYDYDNNSASIQVFKYAIDGLDMTYHSLGEVKGSIINQFAMDEHEGYFRIAATIYEGQQSSNSLFVLDEQMQVIGELNGLAKDERIYSVRYMGDKAYIVTFKEVDPLFVIDMSNPASPTVLGELKIPGYSNYLHFHDENHLIGFGYDTKMRQGEMGSSFIENQGMKISLFDISDYHNPKEIDAVIIGGAGTHSDVMYDHKALFQHKENHLYGFPISIYESSEPFQHKFIMNGALIYEITPENGIKLQASLNNDGEKEEEIDWEKNIRRMIYIGNEVYTISNKQIKSYSLNDFSNLQAVELLK